MATLLTINKGDSFSIAFALPVGYNQTRINSIKVRVGSKVYTHTVSIQGLVECQLTSEQTALLSGSQQVVFTIDDDVFGVKVIVCGDIVIRATNETYTSESVNTGNNVVVTLTLTETAIQVDDVLYNYVKGADGKTAYESAVDGGYTGTEEQFNTDLADVSTKLSVSDIQDELGHETEKPISQNAVTNQVLYESYSAKETISPTASDGYINASGELISSIYFKCLYKVEINTLNKYYQSGDFVIQSGVLRIAFHDENEDFISGSTPTVNTLYNDVLIESIPENAKYISICGTGATTPPAKQNLYVEEYIAETIKERLATQADELIVYQYEVVSQFESANLSVDELSYRDAYLTSLVRTIPNLNHKWINETVARVGMSTTEYVGATVYVDSVSGSDSNSGSTLENAKKTITSAVIASLSGGIIQLADGEYLLSGEASGYLLLNTHAKSLMIRGNVLNKKAVKLTQTSGSFAVRMRDCGYMKFDSIWFDTNQNIPLIRVDHNISYLNNENIFHNCHFTYSGNGYVFYREGTLTTDTIEAYSEFYKCTFDFTYGTATYNFNFFGNSQYITWLFKSCEFIIKNQNAIYCPNGKPNLYLYDNIINMSGNYIAIQYGTDVATPTYTFDNFDIRSNIISYLNGTSNHAILVGRGVKAGYLLNNTVIIPTIANSLALGVVVKSIPDTVGDVLISGNYIDAPRPMYIKGGSNNVIEFNTCINNTATYAPFEFVNYLDGSTDVLSTANVVRNNAFIGKTIGIIIYRGGTSQTEDITIKTCTFSENKYYFSTTYIQDNVTLYTWAEKDNFWTNDINSVKIADITALFYTKSEIDANFQAALGFTPENVSNKKTDLTDNSDTFYPSQKAVKTAVDAKANLSGGNTLSGVQSMLDGIKAAKIYPNVDGTTAIQFTKADGSTSVGYFDTTNNRFYANGSVTFSNSTGFVSGTSFVMSGNSAVELSNASTGVNSALLFKSKNTEFLRGLPTQDINIVATKYLYNAASPTADTVNDTRSYNSAGITIYQVCTVANAAKGGGTWANAYAISELGSYMVSLLNKTGANSVKGTVVSVSDTTDNAFRVNPIDGDMPIGVVYNSGIADGAATWVVVSGIAEVLLVDTVGTTRSYVAYSSSTTAGRLDTSASAPAATVHFREVGHTLESKTGGTNVLVKCILHFN